MKKAVNTVFQTADLGAFKALVGNREVAQSRVEKIKKSIEDVGFIQSPIVVNEKMEVIDGQGRLEACKQLGLPIPFIVVPGLGIKECRSMNVNQENWRTLDYIQSLAASGNEDCIRLLLIAERVSGFTPMVFFTVCLGRDYGVRARRGTVVFSADDEQKALEMFAYLARYADVPTNNRTALLLALRSISRVPGVDMERLVRKVHDYPQLFARIANLRDVIKRLDCAYNKNRRSETFYLETEWLKMKEREGERINYWDQEALEMLG